MELKNAITLLADENISKKTNTVWADLGCGSGLFTYALANLIEAGSKVYAIDRSIIKLIKLQNPNKVTIEQRQLDFIADDLQLQDLDGILMANSLHFAKNKISLIKKMGSSLKPAGGFLIVEYNTDTANQWVPYPLSYFSLQKLFKEAGYSQVRKIHEMPSAFGRSSIYSAIINR